MTNRRRSKAWSHQRFKVVYRTDKDARYPLVPDVFADFIDPNCLTDEWVRPARLPAADSYSGVSFRALLSKKISSEALETLISREGWEQPLKNTSQIGHDPPRDIVDITGMGIGKTTGTLLEGLNRVVKGENECLLSWMYSRGIGLTQQTKYHALSQDLTKGEEQAILYSRDLSRLEKRRIRERKVPFSMLILTPLAYFGTLARHTTFKPEGGQVNLAVPAAVWPNWHENEWWYNTLRAPTLLLLDELDAFSSVQIPVLAHMARLIRWHHRDVQIVLQSATWGNPHEIAPRFLGPDVPYTLLQGPGRRGRLNVNVYEESAETPERLFLQSIDLLNQHIPYELAQYHNSIDRSYHPRKVILFINHKILIKFQAAIGRFSKHFVIVHGDLSDEDFQQRVHEFATQPKKIVLVTTEIIQAGVDLPDVTWGILYGLPKGAKQVQKFLQLMARFVRDPQKTGRVDIILRATDWHEGALVGPENRAKRQAYILREERVGLLAPWYTPKSLEFWIVMGVIMGFDDILERITNDLTALQCPWDFTRDLMMACDKLVADSVVRWGEADVLLPASQTQTWIFAFMRLGFQPRYQIMIQDEETDELTRIGWIDQTQLYCHSLEGQTLPFKGQTYLVKRINDDERTVHVEWAEPEIQLSWNALSPKTFQLLERRMIHPDAGLFLLDIRTTQVVTGITARTHSKRPLHTYRIEREYPAVFLQFDTPPDEAEIEAQVISLKKHLQQEFRLDPDEFQYHSIPDSRYGAGILFIDPMKQDIAPLLYKSLLSLAVCSSSSDVRKRGVSMASPSSDTRYVFEKLPGFLETYFLTVFAFADVHLRGTPFVVYGREVEFEPFWRHLIRGIRAALDQTVNHLLIVFAGDFLDVKEAEDLAAATTQRDIILGLLQEHELLEKTVVLLGNHDSRHDYYAWHYPVHTRRHLALDITPDQRLIVHHGHECGIDYLMDAKTLTDEDVQIIRRNVAYKQRDITLRPEDTLAIGHLHHAFGQQNKELHFMLMPPFRRVLEFSRNKVVGCVGLFGYETKKRSDVPKMTMDRLIRD